VTVEERVRSLDGFRLGFLAQPQCSRLLDNVYLRDYVFLLINVGGRMCPFSVTLQHVPDRELGPLLIQLAQAGFHNPIIKPVDAEGASERAAAPAHGPAADLAEGWRLVRERERESYQWPEERDRYSRYRVFMGTTRAEGAVHIGLGETLRANRWGRDRKYVVAFRSSGSPQQPLAEFVAADDYEETRELLAVIRGSDGGRRMYGAGDALPAVYRERFRTEMYSERVVYPGVWNKVVVVAREDDDEAMLNHALIQGRRRFPR
jgi:hypothetical protein